MTIKFSNLESCLGMKRWIHLKTLIHLYIDSLIQTLSFNIFLPGKVNISLQV